MPSAATWMYLDFNIVNEISQRKTNTIYHSYVESKKRHKGTYLQDINRLTDTKNKFVITKGERGKG